MLSSQCFIFLIVLTTGSYGKTVLNSTIDKIELPSKWKQCSSADAVSSVSKPLQIPDNLNDYASCLPDMEGGTNWFGVMAGITSLIPGAAFISGLTTILSSVSFGESYSNDLNQCIMLMINQALEDNDYEKCKGRMLQIETSKANFMWAIEQPLDDSQYLDYAEEKMAEVTTEFLLIQNDFAQSGDGATDDRHHEKFLDFVFDSLATTGSFNVMLVDAMEKQQLPTKEICTKTIILLHDMESRYEENFEYDGSFSLQRTLDESLFHEWGIKKLWYREDVMAQMGSQVYITTVHDDYRGEYNGDDSFTCSSCIHSQTLFTSDGYCELESSGDEIPEFNDWIFNPKVVCQHCELYAANQDAVRRQQIQDAGENYRNMINAITEIKERFDCQMEISNELMTLLMYEDRVQ